MEILQPHTDAETPRPDLPHEFNNQRKGKTRKPTSSNKQQQATKRNRAGAAAAAEDQMNSPENTTASAGRTDGGGTSARTYRSIQQRSSSIRAFKHRDRFINRQKKIKKKNTETTPGFRSIRIEIKEMQRPGEAERRYLFTAFEGARSGDSAGTRNLSMVVTEEEGICSLDKDASELWDWERRRWSVFPRDGVAFGPDRIWAVLSVPVFDLSRRILFSKNAQKSINVNG